MSIGVSQESLAERARMSASAIGALERGARRAPYRETVALLAEALELESAERAELEAAAEQARGRASRTEAEPPPPHNLPTRLTSFVGREEEIVALGALLANHRLVTITGSGGVGKTRTAVEIARQLLGDRYREVCFVDLSPVADGAFVAGALASVLDVPLVQAADPLRSLAAGLRGRELLLVLDNCEHVIDDAAAAAGTILRTCPGIAILATSRERLAIEGESVYRLPSLLVPTKIPVTTEEANGYAALRLFVERAIAGEPQLVLNEERLETLVEICRQLEGIPLAIELAATRLPALGLAGLNERLKKHFVIAGTARDLTHRHRTMLATIAWSYDLLSANEQALLRRLAAFFGGATLEAVDNVCADATVASESIVDLLSSLVDKSLLSVTVSNDRPRYVMLESVRAFASKKLRDAGEFEAMARAHATWLATIADRGHDLYSQITRLRWLATFAAEIDDARGALEWALSTGAEEDALLAGRIVGGLRGLWTSAERRPECRAWSETALNQIDVASHPLVAVRLIRAQMQSIDGAAVFAAAERAIPLCERIGDRRGLSSLHAHIAWEHGVRGAFTKAERSIARAFELAAEERLQRSREYARLLHARCLIRALAGRLDEARIDATDAAALRDALGEADPIIDLYWDAFFAFADGDAQRSAELLEAGVEHARAVAKNPAGQLCELAAARLVLGEIDGARAAARDALALERLEQVDGLWRAIQHLAAVAALRGRPPTAARLLGFVDAWREQRGGFRGYYERASYDVLIASLHGQISAEAVKAFAAEGSAYDFHAAVNEALSV